MIILILIASSSASQGADCVILQLQVARLQPLVSEVADSGCRQDLSEQALECGFAWWQYGRVSVPTALSPRVFCSM